MGHIYQFKANMGFLNDSDSNGQYEAVNENRLIRFILDVSAFSLERQGLIAFHLDIALKRRKYLLAEKWLSLVKRIEADKLQLLEDGRMVPHDLMVEINQLIRDVVADVQMTQRDGWAWMLIKTSYFSTLDRHSRACYQALLQLNYPDAIDETARLFQNLIIYQQHYLDDLYALPFALEQVIAGLKDNQKAHFSPDKQAELLTHVLTCISGCQEGLFLGSLRDLLGHVMPDLPLDDDCMDRLNRFLLPQILKIMANQREIARLKSDVFPANEIARCIARQTLFDSLGIQFINLPSLVQETLVEPAQQLSNCLSQGAQLSSLICQSVQSNNILDRALTIHQAFTAFDRLANDYAGQLPEWAQLARSFYQRLTSPVTETSWQEYKNYYLGKIAWIPEKVLRFLNINPGQALRHITGFQQTLRLLQFIDMAERNNLDESLWPSLWLAFMTNLTGEFVKVEVCQSELTNFQTNDYPNQYQEYIKMSLEDLLSQVEGHEAAQVVLIHQLRQREQAFAFMLRQPSTDYASLLKDIDLILSSSQVSAELKRDYAIPTLRAMLLDYEQLLLLPLLEAALDHYQPQIDMANFHYLSPAYTTLRHGQALSDKQLGYIRVCFAQWELFKSLENRELIEILSKHLPVTTTPLPEVFTPALQTQALLRQGLSHLRNYLRQFALPQLDGQTAQLDQLVNCLSQTALVRAKIDYCNAIKACFNTLNQAINDNPYQVAKILYSHLSGEQVAAIRDQSCTQLAFNLGQFVWFVIPADQADAEDQLLANLVRYYLVDHPCLQRLYEARVAYQNQINANESQALLTSLPQVLADPLAPRQLLPAANQLIDYLSTQILPQRLPSEKQILDWVQNQLMELDFTPLCPYVMVINLAITVLRSQHFRQKLQPLVNSLRSQFAQLTDKTLAYGQAQLAYYLNIEIASTREMQAIAYLSPEHESEDLPRQAFAEFYLQFQSLTFRNQLNEKKKLDLLALMFPNASEAQRQALLAKMKSMQAPVETSTSLISWLLQSIDFNQAEQAYAFHLLVLNNHLLQAIREGQLDAVGQQAVIDWLSRDVMNQPIPALLPGLQALQAAVEETKNREIQACQAFLNRAKANRQSLLEADQTKPFLGRTKARVHFSRHKIHSMYRLLMLALDSLSLLLSWAALLQVILSSSGGLQILLFALGLTGAIGASATLYGSIILASLVALRVGIKLIKEIWTHKNQFNRLWFNPDLGLINKVLQSLWILAKCLFWAALKTLLTDFIVGKISQYLGGHLLSNLRDGMKAYPSRATVQAEIVAIDALNDSLTDPAQLQGKLAEARQKLTPGQNDLRADNQKYMAGLADLEGEIKRLEKRYNHLSVLSQVIARNQTQPEPSLPLIDLPTAPVTVNAPLTPIQRPVIVINWLAYYNQKHQRPLVEQAVAVVAAAVDVAKEGAQLISQLPTTMMTYVQQGVSKFINEIFNQIQKQLYLMQRNAQLSLPEQVRTESPLLPASSNLQADSASEASSSTDTTRRTWLFNLFSQVPITSMHKSTTQNEL